MDLAISSLSSLFLKMIGYIQDINHSILYKKNPTVLLLLYALVWGEGFDDNSAKQKDCK